MCGRRLSTIADNITLNSGSGGSDIRTDDDGTAHWQYVKVVYGADNTQNIVTSTATNPLPVALSDTDNTVLDNIDTDLTTIAGAVSGSEMQVDVVAALPAGTNAIGKLAANDGVDIGDVDVASMPTNTTSSGSITANGQSVTVTVPAGGSSAGLQITGTWTGQLEFEGTIDGTNYVSVFASNNTGDSVNSSSGNGIFILPAGGFATLRARSSSWSSGTATVDFNATIGTSGTQLTQDVAIDAVTPGTAAGNLGKAEDAVHSSGDTGVMTLVVRNDTLAALAGTDGDYAPLQVNASGALYIQEGSALDVSAATVTVSGTVTANLSATDNAVLDNIDSDLTTIAGAVSGSEMQVDVVAALPAGTNAIGKLAANDGVDIGNVDVTSISAGSNLIGDVGLGVRTSGGTTTYYSSDLDETKAEVTDNAAVNIYSIVAFNTTAAPLFLQLFDLDADNVTVGTTTPTNQYVVPGNADSDGAGFVLSFVVPKTYTTGFTVACTTDSEGSGAPATGACIVNIEYNA